MDKNELNIKLEHIKETNQWKASAEDKVEIISDPYLAVDLLIQKFTIGEYLTCCVCEKPFREYDRVLAGSVNVIASGCRAIDNECECCETWSICKNCASKLRNKLPEIFKQIRENINEWL